MPCTKPTVYAFCALIMAGRCLAGPEPRIFCAVPEYRFGQRDSAQVVEHSFVLKNNGDAELFIKAIRPDCGCIAVRSDLLALPPGGSTSIDVRLALKGLRGVMRKRVIVESNDPVSPLFSLILKGEATTGVTIRPERIALGAVTLDSNDIHDIDILFHTNRPIHILHADVTSPFFEASPSPPAPGCHARITLRALPPFRPGLIQAALVILTDHPEFSRLEVPITGRAVATVYVTPEEITFHNDSNTQGELVRLLVVRSIQAQPFNVIHVEKPSSIRTRIQALRDGVYRIELRFDPVADLDGELLKITTDYPGIPELTIPFRAIGSIPPASDRSGIEPNKEALP